MSDTISQSSAAELASRFINSTSQHIFLTGKAGTGKTTFLKQVIRNTYKNAMIAAPTGIAAINAGGVTIHSLFQLPFGAFIPLRTTVNSMAENVKINTIPTLLRGLQLNVTKRRLLQELELLIIDEVSMLRADLLDAMDTVLKSIRRKNHLPFGGVQVLFIGDMLQLPPVIKDQEWRFLKEHYRTAYFFDAQVLHDHPPVYIELDKIYRQSDDSFVSILNNLRSGQVSPADIQTLNTFYRPDFRPGPADNYIQLTTHNSKAETLNRTALQELEGRSYFFRAEISGDFNDYAYPVEEQLELKKGAQVMFIKNDPSGAQRFFNGKIGYVSSINEARIEVRFTDDGKSLFLDKYTWENIKYTLNTASNEIEENVAGTFTQYPVKLAWAITVHKSQGLTFEKAIIDIGNAFAPGQVYVALSRLTSLKGLILSSPLNISSLHVDGHITAFSENRKTEDILLQKYKTESLLFFRSYVLQCFNLSELGQAIRTHMESYQKDEKRSAKQKHFSWAAELYKRVDEAKTVADRFLNQLHTIFGSGDEQYKQLLHTRILAAKEHFGPIFKELSHSVRRQLELVQDEKKTKAYLQELSDIDLLFFKQLQRISKAEAMVRSAIENREFSKSSIHTKEENQERIAALAGMPGVPKEKKKDRVKKEPKVNTKEVSFQLYRSGRSISEIAAERKMAVVTIEGHLAYYASLGMVDIRQFVSEEKMKNIIRVAKSLDTRLFSPIKQALSDDHSYSEIRFAMAWYLHSKKE